MKNNYKKSHRDCQKNNKAIPIDKRTKDHYL